MSDKFRGKYRNGSARLQSWDYRSAAAYFITICTKDRAHYFGEIQNEKMIYTPAGALAYALWQEIKNHTDHTELGEFVVMPNHVHGILILGGVSIDCTDVACNVPTKNEKMAAISPKSNSISTIIRSYKSAVTKYCNLMELPNGWQPRFHDHIIRDERAFHNISRYIRNNPKNWKNDNFFGW
jgi:REP element-mobilizing transposase RayT